MHASRFRWVSGFAAIVGLVAALAGPQPALAAPCGKGADDAVAGFTNPLRVLAFGRAAYVVLYGESYAAPIENARLDYLNSQGEAFFSRRLTTHEAAYLASRGELRFPIRVEQGEGPVLVRLSYTQAASSERPSCEVERHTSSILAFLIPASAWRQGHYESL
jgi:hypothetical protein